MQPLFIVQAYCFPYRWEIWVLFSARMNVEENCLEGVIVDISNISDRLWCLHPH